MNAEQAQAVNDLDASVLEEAREALARDGALKTRGLLERSVSSEVARAILDVCECQLRFADKFEQVERWLLTREAAEQATRSALASWRANYLRERLPTLSRVTEVGTGIGGDSVYLARHFQLEGFERDPARAMLAAANIARLTPQARSYAIRAAEVQAAELQGELLFVDPARRDGGRKFHPEDWEPPLSSLLSLRTFQAVAVKAAPGVPAELVPEGFELHFLSHHGNLKEAMLLSAPQQLVPRHAWLWPRDLAQPLHLEGLPTPAVTRGPVCGEFLLAPDPALVRSGLLGKFADPLEAGVVHPKIAYLSSPVLGPDPWAESFRILDHSRLNWKNLSQALLAMDWHDFEYLGRGVPFSQNEVLTRLKKAKSKMTGRVRGSVIIYRAESDYQAVLAERVVQPQEAGASG